MIGLSDLVVDLVALSHAMADLCCGRLAHVEVDTKKARVVREEYEQSLKFIEQR